MSQTDDFTDTVAAIRSASTLTEVTFLEAGQSLEASIGILSTLTARFEAVLADLEGENLGLALKALSGMAARINELGDSQVDESTTLEQIRGLASIIGGRIAQMKASLKDVDSLAVNSKIAAASIRGAAVDFTAFAAEIGQTLSVARATLDQLAAELHAVRQDVAKAHAARVAFERRQHDAVGSITGRLAATVKSIASQHRRAAHASQEVRLGSARIQQRIRDAVQALQIGDITRQRLDHAEFALGLAGAARTQTAAAGRPVLETAEQWRFIQVTRRLQSAQLADAGPHFDREVRQIAESLNSLADEARTLRNLGDSAYGSAGRDGGTVITELEGQIGEALALFEDFETARAEVAGVTATVSGAAASLCAHLLTVQSLEADIRIMGLNTTFKCARIGREGLALSVIAQELRTYAKGFAREAGALMAEIESVAEMSRSMVAGMAAGDVSTVAEAAQAMRDSLGTLRRMGQGLDVAMAELDRDSGAVVASLVAAVAKLATQGEVGGVLRDAAGDLAARSPSASFTPEDLTPGVEQMLELIERGYTMASERAVHDRVLGRVTRVVPVVAAPEAELADFLF